MKKITGILILTLATGCSTPEQKENWKTAAAIAVVGLTVMAIATGGGGAAPASYTAPSANYSTAIYDTNWEWDGFRDQFGKQSWQCRGVETGQWAEKSRCIGRPQVDYRWPNN